MTPSATARATAEMARLELGICQLLLGKLTEALPLLASARASIENRESGDGEWPARAARAQFWEALALARMKKKAEDVAHLHKAIAAVTVAGVERQAALAAQKEVSRKK